MPACRKLDGLLCERTQKTGRLAGCATEHRTRSSGPKWDPSQPETLHRLSAVPESGSGFFDARELEAAAPHVSAVENKSDIRSARLEAHAERTGETQGER